MLRAVGVQGKYMYKHQFYMSNALPFPRYDCNHSSESWKGGRIR